MKFRHSFCSFRCQNSTPSPLFKEVMRKFVVLVLGGKKTWEMKNDENYIHSLKLTARPWKLMIGILLSYWGGLFSGAFAVSFREGTSKSGSNPITRQTKPLESKSRHSKSRLWTKEIHRNQSFTFGFQPLEFFTVIMSNHGISTLRVHDFRIFLAKL